MKSINLVIVLLLFSASSFAQQDADSLDGRFHDDLLNHLVGKWNVKAVAHGFSSTAVIEANWVLNHQHFNIHFKGNEVVPWIGVPMEFEYFIGYKHKGKKYVVHGVSVFGSDDYEGFCYAYRTGGNEFKLLQKSEPSSDTTIVQRFTWQPTVSTWHVESWDEVSGKVGAVFLDMKLEAIMPKQSKK